MPHDADNVAGRVSELVDGVAYHARPRRAAEGLQGRRAAAAAAGGEADAAEGRGGGGEGEEARGALKRSGGEGMVGCKIVVN